MDPTLVAEYAALKQRLAMIHRGDRAAYTAGKTDFIRAVTAAAGADSFAESAPVRS